MGDANQFPASTTLKLREYVRGRGGVITEWLSSDPGARAKFRIRVNKLRLVPRELWSANEFRNLGKGLAEIKWKSKSGKVQHRAIGFNQGGYFVLVIGCIHKMRVYYPHDCLETASKRKAEVENDQWPTIDFEP